MINRALGLWIVLLLVSCATVRMGREFDPEAFRSLEAGKATKADVLAMAGEPFTRTQMPDGSEVWTYMRSESRAFAVPLLFYTYIETDTQMKSVTVLFRGDVLERVNWIQGPPPMLPPGKP